MTQVREPAVADMFYPKNADSLSQVLDSMLEKAAPPAEGESIEPGALVVPHAGITFSGPVAASAYRYIENAEFDTVVLIGPSHRVFLQQASVGMFRAYKTPLGEIPVAEKLGEALLKDESVFTFKKQAHQLEHSLEVQLPFLQKLLKPGFSILTVLLGALDQKQIEAAALALKKIAETGRVLFLFSTDLSHDHPYDRAVHMDKAVAEAVQNLDYTSLSGVFSRRDGEACGEAGLLLLLALAKELPLENVKITDMRNSGDIVGDRNSRIVGYMSAVLS